MSRDEGKPAGESFEQKLDKLRMRIDLLPESQRPHLYELADTIKQQLPRTKKHERKDDATA